MSINEKKITMWSDKKKKKEKKLIWDKIKLQNHRNYYGTKFSSH